MSQEISDRLQRIYDVYGSDRSKWGWRVLAQFKCRIRNAGGFLAMQLSADLQNGLKTCPEETKFQEIATPNPAENIAGTIAATDFPDKCALCNLKPDTYDFQIS